MSQRTTRARIPRSSRIDPTAFTPHFAFRSAEKNGARELHCEDVPLEKIAAAAGTPTYIYSRAAIQDAYRHLDRAFSSMPHTICYAVKANSNLSILRILAALGSGFDIVSGGELDRLRRIGAPGNRIVFSGVGKTRDEIRAALRYQATTGQRLGILLFNVESEAELEVFASEAARHVQSGGERPSAALRINPDIVAGGHRHISTGRHHHKFGIEWKEARRLYLAHKNSPWFSWRGISAHIGSQILSVGPYRRTAQRLTSFARELAANGIRLKYVDIGGGMGIRYSNEKPVDVRACAREVTRILRPLGCRLLVEPGRSIVGPAGILLTSVIYVKETHGKRFVIVDAGMNDLIRPALYDALHPITKTTTTTTTRPSSLRKVDVVGPVCETGDFLARDYPLEAVVSGDLLAVWAAGAYGFVESSNYNSRPRPAEVLVEGKKFGIIRRRETYNDLVRGES